MKNTAFLFFMLFIMTAGFAQEMSSDTFPMSNLIPNPIHYSCDDSLIYEFKEKKVCLYGKAHVEYEDIVLDAGCICIDFGQSKLIAKGIIDSSGKYVQHPILKDKEREVKTDSLWYYFETKKGFIYNIHSEEAGGYLHGEKIKQLNDSIYLVKRGAFTTCELEHPHYSICFDKARVERNHHILTGTIWLEVEDIPTPLALPFGYFPNQKKRSSGFLIPSYGESANRGFFLENGGYYFGISDYIDLALRGDIYSRGSWAAKIYSNYKKRYKFEGSLNLNYAINVFGEKFTSQYQRHKDVFIRWQHQQDPRARPRSRFSANVQAGSSNYTTFNPSSANDYLSSNYSSSIAYSTQLSSAFNLAITANHSQNKQTHQFAITLPDLLLTSSRWYPFRNPQKPSLRFKWLEKINTSYMFQAKNSLETLDTLLFSSFSPNNFNYGIKHHIPFYLPLNLFRVITWNTSCSFTEKWYFRTIRKRYDNQLDSILTDTLREFKPVHEIALNSNFSTQFFTFILYKKGPIQAIRHVFTPNIGFSWRPDYTTSIWRYYRYFVPPSSTQAIPYSIFTNPIFGAPPSGKAALITFNFNNNLEMKVKSKNDTITGTKKITLVDYFNINFSYNLAADSLRWSTVNMSGRTAIVKGLDIRYTAQFDPYAVDSLGKNLNTLEWTANRRLLRKNSSNVILSLNYSINQSTFIKNKKAQDTTFYIPTWSLTISYTFQYTENLLVGITKPYQRIQTLSITGDFKPTRNWRMSFMTGYDFINKGLSYTSINIHRDLHCWEIIFNWIPTGFRKSYNFTLRVKSPILQDLKITKKTDFRDYY
ncbi:MAG: putative LPS assembly protein LptD [Bacteroidales bacterium]|nr:putative LPS assembly protein LptD [Bacteroidales bacterium]